MSTSYSPQGDPLFDAILKHDKEMASQSNERTKELKKVYDKHAKMIEHERSAIVGIGHGMWYFDDMIGVTGQDSGDETATDNQKPKRRTSHS